jgi:hypothetical protein
VLGVAKYASQSPGPFQGLEFYLMYIFSLWI